MKMVILCYRKTHVIILKTPLLRGLFSADVSTDFTITHTLRDVWVFWPDLLLLSSLRSRKEIEQKNKHSYIKLITRRSVIKTSPENWIQLYLSSSAHPRIFCTSLWGQEIHQNKILTVHLYLPPAMNTAFFFLISPFTSRNMRKTELCM